MTGASIGTNLYGNAVDEDLYLADSAGIHRRDRNFHRSFAGQRGFILRTGYGDGRRRGIRKINVVTGGSSSGEFWCRVIGGSFAEGIEPSKPSEGEVIPTVIVVLAPGARVTLDEGGVCDQPATGSEGMMAKVEAGQAELS